MCKDMKIGYYVLIVAIQTECASYEHAEDNYYSNISRNVNKKRIVELREKGCSFYEIEKILNLKKNTAKYHYKNEKAAVAKVS